MIFWSFCDSFNTKFLFIRHIRQFVFIILVVIFSINLTFADDGDNENSLKCIAQHLKEKGINEEYLSSVSTKLKTQVNCNELIEAKLSKGFGKIRDKLNADAFFAKHSDCIMKAINTETNKKIILRREAIKINGLGVKVWNYFNQREHLDGLEKEIESSIQTAVMQKCLMVY